MSASGSTPTGSTSTTPGATITPELRPPAHNVVLLVIDAGRPSYLKLTKLPHIQALIRRGVVYPRAWVGQLNSSTPDVHVTFGTGTLPKENGYMGFGWATPATRQQVDFRSMVETGAVDQVLRHLPEPSVTDRLRQYYPAAKSIAASGHKDYAVVGLGGGSADYELYGKYFNHHMNPSIVVGHTPPGLTPAQRKVLTLKTPLRIGAEDQFAFSYSIDVARRVRPRLLMINIPETDTWGHWYGPDANKIFKGLMQGIDRGIGRLEATYASLGMLKNTDFIITADHGMMESKPVYNWHQIINSLRRIGVVARADQESGAIWMAKPARAKAGADRLVALRPNHVEAVFYRSAVGNNYHYVLDSPTSWLKNSRVAASLQDLVDTTAGLDGPDIWLLYRENYTAVSRNVSGKWKGTHGGATWQVQHVPLIIAGPGVRQGITSFFPARAIDIAPTVETLLGLPPIARSGVTLADALTNPTADQTRAEQALAPSLGAIVTALQLQSAADQHWQYWPPVPHLSCSTSPNAPAAKRCMAPPAVNN